MTARVHDTNGWYEIKNNPISRVGIFPYLGREIGAPEPNKVYMVRRSAAELGSQACLDSFNMIPIVDNHTMIGPNKGSMSAEAKGVDGVTGQESSFDGEYLKVNIKLFSDTMMSNIDSGKNELSSGYSCKYVHSPGNDFGQAYDYDQVKVRGNHLALVKKGRMGKQVAVLDESIPDYGANNIFALDSAELIIMKHTKRHQSLAAAIASIAAMSTTLVGLDAANLTEEELEIAFKAALPGMDEALVLTGEDRSTIEAEAAVALDMGSHDMDMDADKKKKEAEAKAKKSENNTGQDAGGASVEEILAGMDKLMAPVLERLDNIEAGASSAAMDARIENGSRTAAMDSIEHIIGPVDHARMSTAAFYSHCNQKLDIPFTKGNEKGAFDAAINFVLKANPKAGPTHLVEASSMDEASTTAESSFYTQNQAQA